MKTYYDVYLDGRKAATLPTYADAQQVVISARAMTFEIVVRKLSI